MKAGNSPNLFSAGLYPGPRWGLTTLPRLLTRLGDTNSLPLTPSASQFKSLHNTYSWLRHCSYSLHPQRCSHHSYSLLISLVDVRSVLQRQVLVTRSTLGGLDLLALITYATSLGLLAYTDNLRNDAGHVYTVVGQTSVVNNVQKQQHGPINYATITTLQVSNLDQDRSHCRKGSKGESPLSTQLPNCKAQPTT